MVSLKICISDGIGLLSNALTLVTGSLPFYLLNHLSLVAKLASTSIRDIGIDIAII